MFPLSAHIFSSHVTYVPQIDVRVFSTLFVHAFSLCVKNLKRRLDCKGISRRKDVQQRVMILVRYDAEAAKAKYVAGSVCLMQVRVLVWASNFLFIRCS